MNRFYRQALYPAKAGRNDKAFVVRHEGNIIAALVLVSHPNKRYLMRAMFISEAFRRQGLGTLLLRHIQPWLVALSSQGGCCYCFSLTHLQAFYEQGGFRLCSLGLLPEPLQRAYCRYSERQDLLVMQFG